MTQIQQQKAAKEFAERWKGKGYASELPYSQRPRWIVTCNFREFWVYDMEQPNGEQKAKIEATAQAILDARAKYPDCSLAD